MIHLKNGKVLFVKMVHYALVLMIELVQICKGKSMGYPVLSRNATCLSMLLTVLELSGYISRQEGQLSLQMAPDKISIWNIIGSINKDKLSEKKR